MRTDDHREAAWLAALLLGAWSATAAASPPQRPEPPVLSIRTELVTLPVTVVDRRGAPVAGLRAGHFRVYDNGEPRTIDFFSSEDVPATIGLVVDNSASMRGRRDDVKSAGLAFARMSHPRDEFFTINFNDAVWPGLPPGVDFTGDMEELDAALSATWAGGMTALYDGVDRALDHLRRATYDRRALIVVSDGGDNASSRSTLDAVLEHARQANAVIYAVTLVEPGNRDARPAVLKRLTRETGGRAYTANRSDDVSAAFERIAREIRSGYTIGFTPREEAASTYRTIRVVVDAGDRRGLTARTRAGYYAGPARVSSR